MIRCPYFLQLRHYFIVSEFSVIWVLLCAFFQDVGITACSQIKNSPTFHCSETSLSFEGNSLFCSNSIDILYLFQLLLYRCIEKKYQRKNNCICKQMAGKYNSWVCVGNVVTRNTRKIFVPAYIINDSMPLLFKTSSLLHIVWFFCNLGYTVCVLPRCGNYRVFTNKKIPQSFNVQKQASHSRATAFFAQLV